MKIGLVLGGGGARGMAHVGALKAIVERGHEPSAIAGTSAGGIVGALYGAGQSPKEIEQTIANTKFHRLLDFGSMGGIIGGKGIERELSKYLPSRFEDLAIPLQVMAVDVQEGELVALRSGPLVPALVASNALPGILSPVRHMDRVFVDGGVLNNLPVDVIRQMTYDPVIAVDVSAPPNRHLDFASRRHLWDAVKAPFKSGQRALTIELFMKAIDIPQTIITELRIAMHPPDVLIRPKLGVDFKIEDFHRRKQAIDAGYRATIEGIGALRSVS